MRYTRRKESYEWEPVFLDVSDIILLMNKAVMVELVVLFHGCLHWVGVACTYDRLRHMFGDQIYYIDEHEFMTIEDFVSYAALDGQRFADIDEPLSVIDSQEGDPKCYLDLVAKIRKDIAKHKRKRE